MSRSLPSVEVTRKFVDESFDPHAQVLVLRWNDAGAAERLWELPDGFTVLGAAPERFALRLRRQSVDSYAVGVLWDRTHLRWPAVSRVDLLGSCLAPLL